MKKVIMYKWQAVKSGEWGWSIKKVWDDWDSVYSDPYYVEIPDDFNLGATNSDEAAYFRQDDVMGYEVSASSYAANCVPYLIGGSNVECILLKVLGPVNEN